MNQSLPYYVSGWYYTYVVNNQLIAPEKLNEKNRSFFKYFLRSQFDDHLSQQYEFSSRAVEQFRKTYQKCNCLELSKIKWPVLGIFGDKDQAIPFKHINQFKAALDEIGVTNEIHIYPGIGHAFANPSGDNYDPKETQDAWEKTLSFLRRYVS